MSQQLVKYDAACRALAAASRVDEVKAIRDAAIARKLYAKMAKNRKLETDAAVIRDRATKKLGDLMKAQAKAVGKAKPRGSNQHEERVSRKPDAPATLAEAGIDKNLAHRARKFASIDDKVFDQAMEDARRKGEPPTMSLINALADAAVDEAVKTKAKPAPKPKPSPLYDPWSKLSHAVRDIADQDLAALPALAEQARRVGFLDIDLEHANKAFATLAGWQAALQQESDDGEASQQRRDTEAGREGASASTKH
jgi:hypothetical protein